MHVKNKRVSVTRRESKYDVGKHWHHPDLQHHLKSPHFSSLSFKICETCSSIFPKSECLQNAKQWPRPTATSSSQRPLVMRKHQRPLRSQVLPPANHSPRPRHRPLSIPTQALFVISVHFRPQSSREHANICPPLIAVQQAQVHKPAMAQLLRLHRR